MLGFRAFIMPFQNSHPIRSSENLMFIFKALNTLKIVSNVTFLVFRSSLDILDLLTRSNFPSCSFIRCFSLIIWPRTFNFNRNITSLNLKIMFMNWNFIKKAFIMSILSLSLLFSCQNDLDILAKKAVFENGKVTNGRFYFSSNESLKEKIDQIKENENEDATYLYFEDLYENGFRSHRPMIDAENEELIKKIEKDYSLKIGGGDNLRTSGTDEDRLFFISDPFLAAFVNIADEIIIGDTLYKFTENRGLFYSHIQDSVKLFDYLRESSTVNGRVSLIPICEQRAQLGGVTLVSDGVSRLIRPIDDGGCRGGGGSGGGGGSTGGGSTGGGNSPLDPEIILQQIISNLPDCSGEKPWFRNLFGLHLVCRSAYDNKTRISTEFWDTDYGFYKSVGILAKTQKRVLWIWGASKSDEIYLGINKVYLKYKFPAPLIESQTNPTLFNGVYKAPVFMYNTRFHTKDFLYGGGSYFVTELNITKNVLPFFDLPNEQILNIYIPKLFLLGGYNVKLTTQDITSESNVKALYQLGIDFLKDQSSSGAPKKFNVSYQKNNNEIEALLFGERIRETNDNKLKRFFYKEVNIVAKYTSGGSGGFKGSSFGLTTVPNAFVDYIDYKLDFYGMARRGNTWKGNRLTKHN